jgi:hypothetical protein
MLSERRDVCLVFGLGKGCFLLVLVLPFQINVPEFFPQ